MLTHQDNEHQMTYSKAKYSMMVKYSMMAKYSMMTKY